MSLAKYWKTVAGLLGAISTWGVTAAADGHITMVEGFGLLGVLATAGFVYQVKNQLTP